MSYPVSYPGGAFVVTQQRQLTIQHLKLVNVAWGEAYVAQRIPGQGAPNVDFSKLMFLCQVNHPEASPLLLCGHLPPQLPHGLPGPLLG